MKLNIVQAVKLGTVACLLAVTTQTIGEDKRADAGPSKDIKATMHSHADGTVYVEAKADKEYKIGDTISIVIPPS